MDSGTMPEIFIIVTILPKMARDGKRVFRFARDPLSAKMVLFRAMPDHDIHAPCRR